jgi:hypothetical protein
MIPRRSFRLILLLSINLMCLADDALAATFTKVLLTGESAPGISGATVSALATPAQLNNNGQLAFNVTLAGAGFTSSNNLALYSGAPGSLGAVLQRGTQAPSLASGITLGTSGTAGPTNPKLSDDGRVVVGWNLATNSGLGVTAANDSMTWVGSAGSVGPLLREGDPAPGLSGVTIASVNANQGVFVTDTGKVLPRQIVAGAGVTTANDNVLFFGTTAGNLAPILREGSQAPGAPAGAIIGGTTNLGTITAKGDQFLVNATLTQGVGGVTADNDRVVFSTGSGGNLTIALREGDEVTGALTLVDVGTKIGSSFGTPRINGAGTMINAACDLLVDGVHASSTNARVTIVGSPGNPFRVVARETTPVPGMPAGVVYSHDLGDEPHIANTGKIAFTPTITGSGVVADANDLILLAGMSDSLHPVVRLGDQAPGFAPSVAFQSWNYTMNDLGSIALLATLSDGSKGIYAGDPLTDQLQLLIKTGDLLEVGPGDARQISNLSADLAFSDSRGAYNNLGQLAFTATFADGSTGVFITQVPEPAGFLLGGIGLLALVVAGRFGARRFNLN